MIEKKLRKWGLFCLLMVLLNPCWGENARTIPIDVYIIVDSSAAMGKGKEEATNWLCSTVIDGILLPEDRLWIWAAGEKPELVYSGALENKETVKTVIRSIQYTGDKADYRGALQQARSQAQKSSRTTYTLLISGSGAKDPPSMEAESAGLLRYSRVENFSGWRVLTVGLDLDPKISKASAFHKNRR